MKKQNSTSKSWMTVSLILLMNLAACVSVNLPGAGKVQPAKDMQYSAPNLPFEKMDTTAGDFSWKNKKTGNIISVFSDCGTNDPTLESMVSEIESALIESKNIKSEKISFNEREALMSSTSGKIDGVLVRIDSIVFKKNSCNYNLTLTGQLKTIDKDSTEFERFVKGFKAP